MNGGAWKAAVHGVTEGRTRLSNFTSTFHFPALEKEMATHSSVLSWRMPGTGAWWAAVYGVAQSRTRLKWLSSSSSSSNMMRVCCMWWESGTCKAKWKITKMRIKNTYNVIIILSEINLKTGRWLTQFSSVQFSRSVMSDSLWPHESQHARPPCPSPTPGVYSDSRPLGQWCHPAISSSVIPFSSCPQSLPTRGR